MGGHHAGLVGVGEDVGLEGEVEDVEEDLEGRVDLVHLADVGHRPVGLQQHDHECAQHRHHLRP